MSQCDIWIELDDDRRQYRFGDTVSGRVFVLAHAVCTCNGLTVSVGWKTHGRGNGTEHELFSRELSRGGQLRPGESTSYRFETTLPSGPATYHGHYLNVDWYVSARVDMPWAFDPKAELDILVSPGPRADDYVPGDLTHCPAALERAVSLSSYVLGGLLLFVMGGLAFLLIMSMVGGRPVGLGLFALLAGWMFRRPLRNYASRLLIGKVDVAVGPRRVHPGEALRCKLLITPRHPSQLNKVTFTLVGEEVCVSGSGTDRKTHTYQVCKESFVIDEVAGRLLPRGRTFELEQLIQLPEDAGYSFYARNNKLVWSVKVHVDVARWPDSLFDYPVEVIPAKEPAGAGEVSKESSLVTKVSGAARPRGRAG